MTTYSPDVAPELEPEVVHWQPPVRAGGWRGVDRGRGVGAEAVLLLAVGAATVGALAIGALAVGVLAVGRLAIGRASFKRVEIDELVVRSLKGPTVRLPWR